jgi:hypothetical protein
MKNSLNILPQALIVFTLLFLGCDNSNSEQRQVETSHDIYKSYSDKSSATIFSMSPGFASLFLNDEISGNEELKDILRDVNQLTFLVVPNNTKTNENAHYIDINTRLENISYSDLALVQSSNQIVNVKISPNNTNDSISEMVVLVSNSESLFCVSFKGSIDLNKITSLTRPENMSAISNLNRLKR